MYRSSINAFRRTLSRRSAPLVLGGGLIVSYSTWHLRRDQETLLSEKFESAREAARRVGGTSFVSPTRSTSALSGIVAASTLEADTQTKSASTSTPDSESQSTVESEAQPADAKGGAFDPETGEINWDCPCLGGMAHGPCGPEFREAFSCFVYSEQEPKGIDCVEKFRSMQDCFRRHPEVYAEELADDEDVDTDSNDGGPTFSGPDGNVENEDEHEPPKGMPPPRDPPTRGAGPRPPGTEGMPKPEDGPSREKRPKPDPSSDRPGSPPPLPPTPEREPILDPPGVPGTRLPAPPGIASTPTRS